MMKVEQACRFRMDSGYGISARSPGFDAQQEKVLGEVFNDTMNSVFSEVGESVLSCTTRGQYVFWARSTLRTDIHSRTTIFTHSYIIPQRDYAAMIEQMPERLLSVPLDRLLNVQTGDGDMEAIEFPAADYQPLDTQALFEKYRLTPERYAILLHGAYEAITGNRTLNLFTTQSSEEQELLVRELTLCILDGLLPSMKKMVTFSSGPDPRMRINVIRSKVGLSGDALIFGVEDDQFTSIRSRDPLRTQMFRDLGRLNREQRKYYLDQIESCLSDMVNMDNCPSLQLIVVAYLRRCTKLTPDTRLALFRNFGAAAGKTMDIKIANQLLEELVQEMIDSGSLGTRELSLIAEWYLADSSEGFRDLADPLFKKASVDVCVALETAILKRTPVNPNGRRLLCLLVNTVDAASTAITQELRSALMQWIVNEDISDLLFFCKASLARFSPRQMEKLVSETLKSTHGKVFSNVQTGIMKTAIENLTDNKILLSEEDISRLDSHIPDYTDELMQTVVTYLFRVRVAQFADVEQAVDLLMKLGNVSPKMKIRIEASLAYAKSPDIKECYQCRSLLPENVELWDIPKLCKEYNTFNNPGGPFEQAIYRRWIKGISQYLQTYREDVRQADEATVRFLKESTRMGLSNVMINKTRETIVKRFWSILTVESIVKCDRPISHEISTVSASFAHLDTEYRRRLMSICGRIKKVPEDSHQLVKLMYDMTPNHADYPEIRKYLRWLMETIVINCHYLPFDLLLMRCAADSRKFDLDRMVDILKDLQDKLNRARIVTPECDAAASVFLGRNSELRRDIVKRLDSGSISELPLCQAITQAMTKKRPAKNIGASRTVNFDQPARPSLQSASSRRGSDRDAVHFDDDKDAGKDRGGRRLFGGKGKR